MVKLKKALAAFTVALLAGAIGSLSNSSLVYQTRSFFGVLRVETDGRFIKLLHGTTLHGMQYLPDPRPEYALDRLEVSDQSEAMRRNRSFTWRPIPATASSTDKWRADTAQSRRALPSETTDRPARRAPMHACASRPTPGSA